MCVLIKHLCGSGLITDISMTLQGSLVMMWLEGLIVLKKETEERERECCAACV